MSLQQSTQSATAEPPAGAQDNRDRQSVRSRPIRFLDPFAIWFSPQSLFTNSLVTRSSRGGRDRRSAARVPAVEFDSQDDKLVITAELPGLAVEDVKVEVIGNVLIIQGEKRRDDVRGPTGLTGNRNRHFYREIVLPAEADPDQTRAEFKNGILRVSVPINRDQRPKAIAITSGQRRVRGAQFESTTANHRSKS